MAERVPTDTTEAYLTTYAPQGRSCQPVDHGVWGRLVERTGGFDLEMLDATTPPDASPKVKTEKTKGSTIPDGTSALKPQVITFFMPQIIDAWLKRPLDTTFEKFIEELTERCKNVTDLQRLLAA